MLPGRAQPAALGVLARAGADRRAQGAQGDAAEVGGPDQGVILAAGQRLVETAERVEHVTRHQQALVAERQAEAATAQTRAPLVEQHPARAVVEKAKVEETDLPGVFGDEALHRAQRLGVDARIGVQKPQPVAGYGARTGIELTAATARTLHDAHIGGGARRVGILAAAFRKHDVLRPGLLQLRQQAPPGLVTRADRNDDAERGLHRTQQQAPAPVLAAVAAGAQSNRP